MADRYASLGIARARIQAMIKRLEDPRPALQVVARKLEDMIRASFDASRSPAGKQFKRLAPSTLKARKPGEGTTPLKKTGETYGSVRVFVDGKHRIRCVFPAHLRIHMSGSRDGKLPKRNVLPFEKVGGHPRLIPKADDLMRRTLAAYHLEGKVVDLPLAAE